jgi:spore maturation protein CgeB
MPTAGDKTFFSDLKQDRPYDLIYLGGRWPYKALTIDKFLIPVLDNVKNCKVHGWGEWPAKYGVSGIDDKDVNQFLNSGRVGPCMSEAHTQAYGIDIPERAFKLVLSGVLAIHDPVPTIKSIVPSMVVARDSKDYYDLIMHYIDNPGEASEVASQQLTDVLKANTYHHRCAALFKTLGHITQSEDMVL